MSDAQPVVLFRNVRVFDGVSTHLSDVTDVLVLGNTVGSVGAPVEAAAGAMVLDCDGRTLMPGLIDAHTHICLATVPLAKLVSSDPVYWQLVASKAAGEMLMRGFTTARDVGGPVFGPMPWTTTTSGVRKRMAVISASTRGSLLESLEQRLVARRDCGAAPVVGAQEGDVVRVRGEHASVGLGVAGSPCLGLSIEQLNDFSLVHVLVGVGDNAPVDHPLDAATGRTAPPAGCRLLILDS
jgi:hypothetical protein